MRNGYDIHEDHAVIVEPTPKDFDLLGWEFIGQCFLPFSEDEHLAVLFTDQISFFNRAFFSQINTIGIILKKVFINGAGAEIRTRVTGSTVP